MKSLGFFGEPNSRAVVSSDYGDYGDYGDYTLDEVRVLERMNSLIVMPAKVASV
jgi:hypothetical protein